LPRNLSSEISQFISANQAEFAELLTFIDFSESFTLGFVEINFAPEAEFLIEALKNEAACQEIQFFVLNFCDQNLRFVRDEILKTLPTIVRESNKKLVLIVRGLEKLIGVFGDYPPVLQDLNFVRDAYRRTVPHPLLFILPDYAITRLAKFAPDFWAWKSGIFQFKTTQATKDYAVERTLNSEIKTERLPRKEQQERIDLLERLLMENQPTGHQATGENLRNYNNILHQLGVAYLTQRDPDKARGYLEEAVKKVEQNSSFHAEVLNTLGRAYEQQRQLEMAISCHQKALEISRNLESLIGEAAALFYLGNAYLELRQFTTARELYQQCLKIEQVLDDRFSQAGTLHQLGRVAQELREYEQANNYYQQALDIKIEFSDRFSQASTLHQLGRVAQELREYEQAKHYYQQALDIKIEFSDRFSQADTLHQLGRVAQELREYEQAKHYYQQALDIYIEFSDRYSQASTLHQLGRVAQELREYEQAKHYYQQALDIKIEFSDRYSQASTYGQLGLLAEAQEDYPEAKANFEKALEIFVEYKDEYREAIVRRGLERL
jgi:tetratricopeptide (TPR) repeat protein